MVIQPYISVVLGTYNRLEMLKQSVESIYKSAGTYSVELIINDGGSTDGTIEWLEGLSAKKDFIKIIFSGKLEGITKSYNKGFALATAKYVTWSSDDIIMENNSLCNMCKFMENLNENDMAAFQLKNRIPDKETFYIVPKYKNILCPNTGCLRLSCFKKLGFWNEDYLDYCQDLELAAQIYRIGGTIKVCPDAKLLHIYKPDKLRQKNIVSWSSGFGNQKWELANNQKFGQKTPRKVPSFLLVIENGFNVKRTIPIHNKIKKFYRNIYVVASSKTVIKNLLPINNIFPLTPAQKLTFDVIFLLSNKGIKLILPRDNKIQKSRLVRVLIGKKR